jgi:hypothetical protein
MKEAKTENMSRKDKNPTDRCISTFRLSACSEWMRLDASRDCYTRPECRWLSHSKCCTQSSGIEVKNVFEILPKQYLLHRLYLHRPRWSKIEGSAMTQPHRRPTCAANQTTIYRYLRVPTRTCTPGAAHVPYTSRIGKRDDIQSWPRISQVQ